jgi:predicted histidine transporter YuiF (NhaC family)
VELLLNPVLISVVVLCLLCLMKLNVLMSLILAAVVGAVAAGIAVPEAMNILCGGFGANANTALSYIFLGTFASAVASTGLANMISKKLSKMVGTSGILLMLVLAGVACLSQNLVPVHIAFIPILIPPMLRVFNELQIDRRGAACSLAFGLKAPYICIPFGFGAIFMNIIADNMTANGMTVTIADVTRYNWIIGLAMNRIKPMIKGRINRYPVLARRCCIVTGFRPPLMFRSPFPPNSPAPAQPRFRSGNPCFRSLHTPGFRPHRWFGILPPSASHAP